MLKQIPFYSSLIGQPVGNKAATTSHILVYGAIEVHSFGEKGCIASNKLIGSEIGIGMGRTANIISELSQSGWIKIILDENRNRKQIIPLLKIVRGGYHAKVKGVSRKSEGGYHAKVNRGIQLENNIYIYKKILDFYNSFYGKTLKSSVSWDTNCTYWLTIYTLEEILTAIKNIHADNFWKDKMDLTMLFRRKNPRGEAVDYIGQLLNKVVKDDGYINIKDYNRMLAEQKNL